MSAALNGVMGMQDAASGGVGHPKVVRGIADGEEEEEEGLHDLEAVL